MIDPHFLAAATGGVMLALAFVLLPLRDRAGFFPLVGLIFFVPAATLAVYLMVGTPEGVDPETGETGEIRRAVTDLAERALAEPGNADRWARLGLAYKRLEEFGSAEHAFRRALFINPDNAYLKAELGETLLYASGQRRLPEAAQGLLEDAAADGSQKALWLLGLDAFQRESFNDAERHFERLMDVLPTDSEVRPTVEQYLARARTTEASADSAPSSEPSGPGPTIDVTVSIDNGLADRLQGDETLFVIVRRAQSAGPPLAVKRLTVAQLPARLTLDDSDAMMAGAGLSSAEEIVVVARVSFSGRAESREGDFQGQTDILRVGDDTRAEVHIEQVL